MPLNPRVRDNNVFGTTTDNPLTAGAITFNSQGLINMSVIAAKHAVITLDPLRQFGNPEIIVVTAHTAAATVATITRGAYGTTPREHQAGTLWVHAPLDEDFIEIATSSTRPSDPYKGQLIFESDTNKLVGYGGVDWAPRDSGGQIGYVENRTVTDQNITAGALLTGLSIVATIGTGRRIRIVCKTNFFSTTAVPSGDGVRVEIREDGTAVESALGNTNSAVETLISFGHIRTPVAGSHTYTVFATRAAGAGTVNSRTQAVQSSWLLVEDIGAA